LVFDLKLNLLSYCASGGVDALEKGVHVKLLGEVGPMRPILQADFLSQSQDPIGGVCPRSTEKMGELTVLCSRSMIQELSCGRGKSELKRAKRSHCYCLLQFNCRRMKRMSESERLARTVRVTDMSYD
jgi:hypothetical protein